MGNTDTKIQYRKAVIKLTTINQSIDANDSSFWSQFWSDQISNIQDIYTLIPASEIRALREDAPSNLATLCFKIVERLVICVDNACNTQKDQTEALNCVRLLTRILPYIFEEPEWRGFFWVQSSSIRKEEQEEQEVETLNESVLSNSKNAPLAQILLRTLVDLLFMPDFTATTPKKVATDQPLDIHTLDSCEYIWEAGIGYAHSPPQNPQHNYNRVEILKLILATFSETMYLAPTTEFTPQNKWIDYFTSSDNRHTLPLFTSLLNILFSYDPIGYGMPYNYILFNDSREPLVEIVAQILCVTLEQNINLYLDSQKFENFDYTVDDLSQNSNLFINYLTRLHRDEDFAFILKGFSRLLNNPLIQTYLPGSAKKISFYQELFILFWKFCDLNKKFLYYVLKSSEVLDILVPILYYLIDSRADTSKIGLMHIGVFILLLLSGERNFGVRLNKPYTSRIQIDVPVFNGTHADLLIIVFHKIITTSHQRLQPLYDCLLTIIVNISPYIKSLSMVTSTKLIHLLEAFCTPWFLISNSTNHHLVFFILEAFNNIIQYQFDGNPNLIYTIIRKRVIFYNLLNLNIEQASINKALNKQQQQQKTPCNDNESKTSEKNGGKIVNKSVTDSLLTAKEAEPGTLKTTLAATPSILNMTEKTTPSLTLMDTSSSITSPNDINSPSTSTAALSYPNNSTMNDKELFKENKSNENDFNFNQLSFTSFSSQELNNTQNSTKTLKKTTTTSDKNDSISSSTSLFNMTVNANDWQPSTEWVQNWKHKLPLQTIMRLLQVLVPQVEKICIDKNLTDESEILKFLQHGTLVGLLPVPHPILIRKYQPNHGTAMWFRTYIWGVIYLRNTEPPIWYDSDVKLFEIQRV